MLKRKSLILMLLFSFLAHLAIAGSLIYAPLRFSGNDRVIRTEKVIWGIVQNQVAGENSRRDRPSGLSLKRVAGKKRKTEVGSKKSEVRNEIPISLQDTEEPKNVIPTEAGIQNKERGLDSHFPGNDVIERGFSSETHRTFRLTKEDENNPLLPVAMLRGNGNPAPLEKGGKGGFERPFSDESIEIGSKEREIDGRSGPEVLYSQQETSQPGINGGCNESNRCTDMLVSDHQTSSAGKIIAHGGESGRYSLREILEEVRREIERHKYYPPFARKNGIEGTVYMNFHIGRDGKPGSISIGRSSGFKILDDSATKTLKDIKQFPTIPEEMRGLGITVPIAYKLTEEKN